MVDFAQFLVTRRPAPRRLALLVAGLIAVAIAPVARAQTEGDDAAADPQQQIDDAVAAALFDRGQLLFAQRDYRNAKLMFIESLERSNRGPVADKSRAMLRSTNERLGVKNLDDGMPSPGKLPTANQPIDPYGGTAGAGGQTGPLDPYGDGGPGAGASGATGGTDAVPVDPYGNGGGAGGGEAGSGAAERDHPVGWSRRDARNYSMLSLGAWGALTGGFFGDLVTGVDSSTTGEVVGYGLAGAAIGVGAGYLYGTRAVPSAGDLALVNSLAGAGTLTGLLLGVAIDPVESEAYSLQGMLGGLAGMGAGFYLTTRLEVSPRRMMWVDAGATGGAAVIWAGYLFFSDSTTNNDEQTAGALSVVALAGGGALTWWLTRHMDDKAPPGELPGELPVAALFARDRHGHWGGGLPLPRPMENPALAPPTGATSLGLDLVGGRF